MIDRDDRRAVVEILDRIAAIAHHALDQPVGFVDRPSPGRRRSRPARPATPPDTPGGRWERAGAARALRGGAAARAARPPRAPGSRRGAPSGRIRARSPPAGCCERRRRMDAEATRTATIRTATYDERSTARWTRQPPRDDAARDIVACPRRRLRNIVPSDAIPRERSASEAVRDRQAPVAAECLVVHADARRRLPALVLGQIDEARDALGDLERRDAAPGDLLGREIVLDVGLDQRVELARTAGATGRRAARRAARPRAAAR